MNYKKNENENEVKSINTKNMHLFMTAVCTMILMVHVGYLIVMLIAGYGLLSFVNVFSISAYAFCAYNFYHKRLKDLSYYVFYSEILIFSTLMTWCTINGRGFALLSIPIIPFSGLIGYMFKVRFHRRNYFYYYIAYVLSFFLALNFIKTTFFPQFGFVEISDYYRKFLCIYSCAVCTCCICITSLAVFSIANSDYASQDLKIEKLSLKLFITLSQTVEAKDLYTNGHSIRVASYSQMIAKAMGFPKRKQRKIYFCGLLHDIGKISVSDSIINKAGKLTDDEYNEIKKHSVSGWNILHLIDEFPELAEVARWHHERYDGKGYPDGKKKNETPIYVRIVSLADAYDAMTSNRSYRSIMKRSKVLSIIEEEKGKQFDPVVCDAFLKILANDKNYDMREKTNDNLKLDTKKFL